MKTLEQIRDEICMSHYGVEPSNHPKIKNTPDSVMAEEHYQLDNYRRGSKHFKEGFDASTKIHEEKIEKLQSKLEVAEKALEDINNEADAGHQYNSLEFRLVMIARAALKKLRSKDEK